MHVVWLSEWGCFYIHHVLGAFVGELVKFGMFPKTEALHCLKMLLFDFSHHNIDMACGLLESCGRYMYRSPDSHHRTRVYLVGCQHSLSATFNQRLKSYWIVLIMVTHSSRGRNCWNGHIFTRISAHFKTWLYDGNIMKRQPHGLCKAPWLVDGALVTYWFRSMVWISLIEKHTASIFSIILQKCFINYHS